MDVTNSSNPPRSSTVSCTAGSMGSLRRATSLPAVQPVKRAVAGQEHGVLLIETWLKFALVVQIKVRIVWADPSSVVPADAPIAEQNILAVTAVVRAVAVEDANVVHMGGLVGNHRNGHRQS